ncbi:MAG: type III pantothenate kinase [Bacteroidales bacterium]|nr:type III pantothenate kinase [Bacteroidales bacterium]
MLLTVDRGNTRDKFVLFDGDKLFSEKKKIFSENNFFFSENNLAETDGKKIKVDACVFCSVKSEEDDGLFVENMSKHVPVFKVDKSSKLPFVNGYKSSSLGNDRLALTAGALHLFGTDVLVIDAGTCITYDYLNADKVYCGGSISPGIQTKYKALHNFTAKLPLLTEKKSVALCADNTEDCIVSGVVNGTAAEIEQTIRAYVNEYSVKTVVLTGGDGEFFYKRLKHLTVYEESLIHWGLKNIYEINVQK